jgi:D-alanyl-D-alanine carboxypeptidase
VLVANTERSWVATGVLGSSHARAQEGANRECACAAVVRSHDLRYATRPITDPGTQWAHSNTGYILLGLVIERATHSTVATQLHRRLLPCSRFPRLLLQGDERPTGPVATGYQDTDRDGRLESFRGRPYVPTTSEATAAWAAGGIATSARDLARAIHGILTGTLAQLTLATR